MFYRFLFLSGENLSFYFNKTVINIKLYYMSFFDFESIQQVNFLDINSFEI